MGQPKIRTVYPLRESLASARPEHHQYHCSGFFFHTMTIARNQGPRDGHPFRCIKHGVLHVKQCGRAPAWIGSRLRSKQRVKQLEARFACKRFRCVVCTPHCDCEPQPQETRRSVLMSRTRPARDQARCLWCNEAGLKGHADCAEEPTKPYRCEFLDCVPGEECKEPAVAVMRPKDRPGASLPVCQGCLDMMLENGGINPKSYITRLA